MEMVVGWRSGQTTFIGGDNNKVKVKVYINEIKVKVKKYKIKRK